MWRSGGSAGSLQRISETVLTEAAASVDIQSIPATYRHLRVVVLGRSDTAAAGATLLMRFNNDSAGNYDNVLQSYQGTNGSGDSSAAAATSARIGTVAAASATSGEAGMCEVLIPNYAGTTFQKVAMSVGNSGIGTTVQEVGQFSSQWNSTSAITRITVLPGAGNFIAGTVVSLYGLT